MKVWRNFKLLTTAEQREKKNKILLTASYNRGTQRLFSVKYMFGAAAIA